ncbi:slipin family protein [Desulfobulbus sp. AH-315-M07]|nr:slipin family protein [Desulfobulbus sp. AH-315-M07]
MFKTILVALDERVVVFQHGLPVRALAPGKHRLWGYGLSFLRLAIDQLVFGVASEVRAVLPSDWYAEVEIGDRERAVLYRDGCPTRFLTPGLYRYWTLDASVRLERYDVEQPMPQLTRELMKVIPSRHYVDVQVAQHEAGLHYVGGRFVGTLEPGRYTLWTHPSASVTIRKVDMRRVDLQLSAQELMTRDKVTLRLSLSAIYAVADAAVATHAVTNVRDALYLMIQLAARDFVSGVTLDELLEGREALSTFLAAAVIPKAHEIGVLVEHVGAKDIVLPGEMKTLLNRVIEAEKEAAANVILRREETAATRSLANTARMMSEQPTLMRLRELESLKDIASEIGEIHVVVGTDGFDKLIPAGLLSGKSNGR